LEVQYLSKKSLYGKILDSLKVCDKALTEVCSLFLMMTLAINEHLLQPGSLRSLAFEPDEFRGVLKASCFDRCECFIDGIPLIALCRSILTCLHSTCQVDNHFYSAPQCERRKRCTSYGNAVCLSVRLSVTRRYCVKITACSTVHLALSDSKMCLVL